jgi:hypothetical protein
MKFTEEKLCLDPFEKIHEDVHDLIHQHFNFTEVLAATNVSKSWNQNTGQSNTAMKKIKLQLELFTPKYPSTDKLKQILNSNRRYQNIHLNLPFLTHIKKWLQILVKFDDSLVELNLKNVAGSTVDRFCSQQDLSFPKLQRLEDGVQVSENLSRKIIKNSKLTAFYLEYNSFEMIKLAFAQPTLQLFSVFDLVFQKPTLDLHQLADLPVNNSIIVLSVAGSSNFCKTLLKCLPNLIRLYFIDWMACDFQPSEDLPVLKMIAETALNLKEIFVLAGNLHQIENAYEELKTDKTLAINRNIVFVDYSQ